MQRLSAALDSGTMTLIAGEAGVGKSRLAAEASSLASGRRMARLIGQCSPDSTVPYSPFVMALRRHTRAMEAASLEALFDGPATLASALLPEVASAIGLPAEKPQPEDLFAAVWQVLHRLAGPNRALLVLEDLHWADTESLQLLTYLAREQSELGVWIVATYRSDELHRRHPLTAMVAELSRARAYEEISLGSLGREDLRRMVSAILDGTEVGDEFLDALWDKTAGNPFFVEELLKVLLERGDIYREAGDWARRDLAEIELPITVRETLLDRARTLQNSELEILQLAALAGDELDLSVLSRAAAVDPSAVDDLVDKGLRLQLLTERRDGPRTVYAFRHALTREAFADEMVGPVRERAHARLAAAITAVHALDLDAFAAQLADHYRHAGEVTQAVVYGSRAARRAASFFALEEAGRQYERALHLLGHDASERLPLLLEAAEVLIDAPDRRLAVAFAGEARDVARERSDLVAEARALDVLEGDLWSSGDSRGAVAIIRDAFALVRGRNDWQEALVIARLVRLLALSDEREEAMALLPIGIDLATRVENFQALCYLYGTRMNIAPYGPEQVEAFQAGIEAAEKAGDGRSERNLTTNAGYVQLWCGNFERARHWLQRAVELHNRLAPHDRYAEAGYAWLLSLLGDYDAAMRHAAAVSSSSHVPTRIVALTASYEVAERRGDLRAGAIQDELCSEAARTGESQRSVPAMAARARHALLSDGSAAATPLFWDALAATTTARGTGSHWLFSPDLARVLRDEGRVQELERWAAPVHALTGADPTPHNRAADALTVAYLLSAQDDTAGARVQFEEAHDLYQQMPCPVREAEALIGLADLEWRTGDAGASSSAARRAVETSRRIGAATVEQRAEDALRRIETPSALTTLLFTDIVSSTERVAALGDQAWSAELARHHGLVRGTLYRFNGREVDTAGDGFLATFDSPAQGIRCALAIREALAATGIEIRAGLHTGEVQVRGDQVIGIAVHIAARVSAAAGPNEILVSGTVRDLVAGAGLPFTARGVHSLKGVPGEWALFAVGERGA